MNGPENLQHIRDQLREAVLRHEAHAFEPIETSPWIMMSVLIKAVRRGREDLALRAAAMLLRDAPDKLWRRIGGLAFEEVGLADIGVMEIITAALAGRRFRSDIGPEWAIASTVVAVAARAPKCRSADDLLMAIEAHPDFADARLELPSMSTRELLAIMIGDEPLPVRALACWLAIGTNRRPSPHLAHRRGDPRAVFDTLNEAGYPHTLVETAGEGFRRTSEVLAPFTALLWPLRNSSTQVVADDEMPPETMIGDIPGWALDIYTRQGRRAFKLFLQQGSPSARWINMNVPAAQRVNLLGNIVFRIEGGLVRRRSRWPLSDQLRHMVDVGSHGLEERDATELQAFVTADLPLLQEARRHAL